MDCAPIALFLYNRPDHTRRTFQSLVENPEVKESELFVFCDGPKEEENNLQIEKVTNVAQEFAPNFKSFTLKRSEVNNGLADSIVSGVTQIVEREGRVIVLEDDLEFSPIFLKYMNEALSAYEPCREIMHINGYCKPVGQQVYLTPLMMCWGWATWADSWKYFTRDIAAIERAMTSQRIAEFTDNGRVPSWQQFLENKSGEKKTWAVFWALSIFLNRGLCLSPPKPLVNNHGNDGSGVHASQSNFYTVIPEIFEYTFSKDIRFDEKTSSELSYRLFPPRSDSGMSILSRLRKKMKRLLKGANIKT